MDTSPKNQQALTYGAKPAPAPARELGEVVWTLRKGIGLRRAELRDRETWGVEVQIFDAKDLIFGQRYPTRAQAERAATDCRRDFEAEGWT